MALESNLNVVNPASKSNDGRTWGPIQMLSDAIDEVESGDHPEKKVLILWLNDSDGNYQVGFSQCGMTVLECVLLCEFGKDRMKQEFVGEDDDCA